MNIHADQAVDETDVYASEITGFAKTYRKERDALPGQLTSIGEITHPFIYRLEEIRADTAMDEKTRTLNLAECGYKYILALANWRSAIEGSVRRMGQSLEHIEALQAEQKSHKRNVECHVDEITALAETSAYAAQINCRSYASKYTGHLQDELATIKAALDPLFKHDRPRDEDSKLEDEVAHRIDSLYHSFEFGLGQLKSTTIYDNMPKQIDALIAQAVALARGDDNQKPLHEIAADCAAKLPRVLSAGVA
jgi:hypothetical protein